MLSSIVSNLIKAEFSVWLRKFETSLILKIRQKQRARAEKGATYHTVTLGPVWSDCVYGWLFTLAG